MICFAWEGVWDMEWRFRGGMAYRGRYWCLWGSIIYAYITLVYPTSDIS